MFMTCLGVLSMVTHLRTFSSEQVLVARESESGVSMSAFFVSQNMIDLLWVFTAPAIMLGPYYYLTLPVSDCQTSSASHASCSFHNTLHCVNNTNSSYLQLWVPQQRIPSTQPAPATARLACHPARPPRFAAHALRPLLPGQHVCVLVDQRSRLPGVGAAAAVDGADERRVCVADSGCLHPGECSPSNARLASTGPLLPAAFTLNAAAACVATGLYPTSLKLFTGLWVHGFVNLLLPAACFCCCPQGLSPTLATVRGQALEYIMGISYNRCGSGEP